MPATTPDVPSPTLSRSDRPCRRWTLSAPCALWLALLFPAVSDGAGAQPDAPEPPRFELEEIAVEGQRRVSSEIVISQSLLVAGRSYSESELRDGLHRVRRLPFVLDAELRLDRGTERGRYRLVLVVRETSLFFYAADASYEWLRSRTELPGFTFRRSDDEYRFHDLTLGARRFVGRTGVLFAAIDEGLAAGYTRYDLFGSRAFLTAGVRLGLCCNDPRAFDEAFDSFDETLEASVGVGVPLRGNHSLLLGVRAVESSRDLDGPLALDVEDDVEVLGLEARWVFDSTDDPILPWSGRRHSAGVDLAHTRHEQAVFFGPDFDRFELVALDTTRSAVVAESIWLLPLGRRHTLGIGATAVVASTSTDPRNGGSAGEIFDRTRDELFGSLELSYARRIWERRSLGRYQALRWESSVEVGHAELDSDGLLVSPFLQDEQSQLLVRSGVAYRNRFGVVRLSLSYSEGRAR
jgi:hypothetical protein